MTHEKEILTTREAAEYMEVAQDTVRKYCSSGLIKSYRPAGKKTYIKREDLISFLTSREVKSNDQIKFLAHTA